MDDNDLKTFENRIGILRERYDLYEGATFRALVRGPESDPELVNILAALHLEKPGRSSRLGFLMRQLIHPHISLIETHLDLNAVFSLLREAFTTETQFQIASDNRKLAISLGPTGKIKPSFHAPRFLGREDMKWQYHDECGAVVYFFNSGIHLNSFQLPNESFQRIGFRTLQEVLWYYVLNPGWETPESPQLDQMSGIYLIAPNYHARLDETLLEGQRVKVKVDLNERAQLHDFRLVLEAWGSSGRGWGGSVILPPKIWDRLESPIVEHEYISPPHRVTARLYWNLGRNNAETFVDEQSGVRASTVRYPRLAAYSHFDPDLKRIEAALIAEKDKTDFEWSIASLLSICGFQVQWLGYKGRGKKQIEGEVDIIAYHPTEPLAIIAECTLAWADFDRKLSKLAERAAELQTILEGWKLKTAIFTTIGTQGLLPHHKTGASERGISLVTREVLPRLVRAVKSALPPEQLWERLTPALLESPGLLE